MSALDNPLNVDVRYGQPLRIERFGLEFCKLTVPGSELFFRLASSTAFKITRVHMFENRKDQQIEKV